ncbi:MAG: hypothetical protein AB2L20_11835 [Mangrovibacterium sp.]
MAFERNNKFGNRFSPDNQPKKSGRKPSLYKQLKELTGKKVEFELSKEDYFKTIRFLMERNKDELTSIFKDPKTPIWACNIINAIITDTRYGSMTTVNSIFDRIFGKATQPQEVDMSATLSPMLDLSKLSTDELKLYQKILEKASH